jgi:predicted amidophosphoribosyltransferase
MRSEAMGMLGQTWSGLADLVLPGTCAGCGTAGAPGSLCPACLGALEALRPHQVRPTPAPAGLPACVALGGYDGVLREVLLAYKERGRHVLARALGDWLAGAVATGIRQAGYPAGTPVLLVPVPDTAAAARERYGDHMRRLARRTAVRLNAAGWPAGIAAPVLTRPRPDSAHLDAASRAAEAARAFAPRPRELARMAAAVGRGAVVVPVDDILTTGGTLAALAAQLRAGGLPVPVAAVLAATRRRSGPVPRRGEFCPERP